MGVSASFVVQAYLSAVWVYLTPDTIAIAGMGGHYGIDSNGPADCVASPGQLQFTLRNDAKTSGGLQGYYSPRHANVRAGWGFGVAVRWVWTYSGSTVFSVSSLTRASSTATATTSVAHGLTTGQWVTIAGADQSDYNGVYQVTVTGGSTFTYAVANAPATPATGTITATQAFVKFYGKVVDIAPSPGRYATQQVVVTAVDGIADLLEADAREVTLQVNQTESQIIAAVLASVPASAQPLAQSLDTGVDTFPFAFDNLSSGVKALPLIRDCALSSAGLYFQRGDGMHLYKNRHTRATASSSVTLSDTMHGFAAPSSVDRCWNKVRTTTHPKVVSAAATDELYALPAVSASAPAAISIPAGATVTTWCDYSDPNVRTVAVGGQSVVTVLVGGTHYAATANDDGTGANLTADIAATLTPFASTGKYVLTNNGADTAYLTVLKVIGKAVRDPGPQHYEASSVQAYGERSIEVDLPYQNDSVIAQSYATYIEAQYRNLTNQIDSVTVLANTSDTLMTHALAREPGDVVTITETMTGVAALKAVIYRVDLKVDGNGMLTCTWGLAPASPFLAWQVGIVGASELGVSTFLGF